MNMKKILLAGIALGSLAATAANATTWNGNVVRVSGINLAQGAVLATNPRVTYSNQLDLSVAANRDLQGSPAFTVAQLGTFWDSTTAAKSPNLFEAIVNPGTFGFLRSDFPVGNTSTNTYQFTFALGGDGTPAFASAVTGANFTVLGGVATECAVSAPQVVLGGGQGAQSVTVNVTINNAGPNGCNATNAPNGLRLSWNATSRPWTLGGTIPAPTTFTPGTATMTATILKRNEGTLLFEPYAGGDAITAILASPASLADIAVSALYPAPIAPTAFATINPTAGFNNFTSLLSTTGYDSTIGNVKVAYLAETAANFPTASNGLPATTTGVQSGTLTTFMGVNGQARVNILADLTFTNSGSFAAYRPAVAGVTMAAAPTGANLNILTGVSTTDSLAGLAATNITVATVALNNIQVTTPQSITLAARLRPVATATYLTSSPALSGTLETIGQQGAFVDAPWISGSVAAFPSIIRMTNNGTTATGAISLTLSSVVDGVAGTPRTCTSTGGTNVGALPALAGIAPGGELLVDTAAVTTCFGNFRRGDLRITFVGGSDNVAIKQRILSGGVAAESSLGYVADGGKTAQ